MIAKQCGGLVPQPHSLADADRALLGQAEDLLDKARAAMAEFALHQMLADIWKLVADGNRYFAGEEPWRLAKTDRARMARILYVTAELLRRIAILAQPAMPAAMGKLLDGLAVPSDARDFVNLGRPLEPGLPLPPPAAIFPRYVEAEPAQP
jgi:methionyl-tRNA synthetase